MNVSLRRLDLALICLCFGSSVAVCPGGAAHAQGPSAGGAPTRTASAQEASEQERAVEALLGLGIETATPVSTYAALGEPGTRALIAIFERDTAPRHIRLRALGALSALETPTALDYLASLLVEAGGSASEQKMQRLGNLHPQRSTTVLRRTLRGLERHPARVPAADVMPYLAHRDAAVRLSAVRLLAQKPDREVTQALHAQRDRERSGAVRQALTSALKDRSAPPAAPRQDAPESGSQPR